MECKLNVLFLFLILINIFYQTDGKEIYRKTLGDTISKINKYKRDVTVIEGKIEKINKSGENVLIATASMKEGINKTGWTTLNVWGNSKIEDKMTAYYVGQLEGIITGEYIYKHWYNTVKPFCKNRENICIKIYDFITENNKYIQDQIKSERNTSSYWYQVSLYYEQLKGLYDGYNISRSIFDTPFIPFNEIMLMNIEGDLMDLVAKYANSSLPSKLFNEGHCSAIIKLLYKNKDLLVAHNTWTSYRSMHRILKKYDTQTKVLPSSTEKVPGGIITFSSYPGKISSVDDFYQMSSGLVVQETTIGNSNSDLWEFITPNSVTNGVRVMVANRLANNGENWANIFQQYNSGTYNNQWMVVDYNKFKKGKSPKNGLLWIIEEIPGTIIAGDQTKLLKKNTYWPSYNLAFYETISKLNGDDELAQKYGDWYSYSKAPRAKIMKRDHRKIKNLNSLMSFMRYNDYKNDPFAKCSTCDPPYSASLAIASRHDLNPANGTYPLRILGHRYGGATDAKITNSALVKELKFIAVSGPTTGNNLPVFKWSTSDFGDIEPHLGHPDEWNFKPIKTEWD